ncbi:ImpA family type VI secretion system protein [Vibrio vulnificus]|uniref:type VI secretion protein n=1 Tax=Vibrio vulnificus TaxID=672 RepID=UPI004059AE25|nr:ImpA family type VI secretion system protein [Vibrio vulnificus]EJA3100973.1 ImpA family type VI secretion system protein [Vibrio vulnificus]
MSNVIFIDNLCYRLTSDSQEIRGLEPYFKIREEINRRFNPIVGGTDWQCVKEQCELLAFHQGMDFLVCGYYAVACLKTQGLSGYAKGMELMSASLANQGECDVKSAKIRKEILDWVNARVVHELKTLKPNYESLRDLYRAERYCERLHQLFEYQQTEYKVDFEGVGFALFEHIDRIETHYHSLLKKQNKNQMPEIKLWQKNHGLAVLGGLGIAIGLISGYWVWPWFQTTPYSAPQIVTTLNDDTKSHSLIVESSQAERVRWQNTLIPLYRSSLEQNLSAPFNASKQQANSHLILLQTLYPKDERVTTLGQEFSLKQQIALEQTEMFISKFSEIRTKMANIALLAKKGRWKELEKQTKSLEDFAVSLSPIYGRVDYVQDLIRQGDISSAEKELSILQQRLDSLSWKIVELELSIRNKSKQQQPQGDKVDSFRAG